MADLTARLTDCFTMVFPGLSRQEISSASAGSLASWDSIAAITLFSLIEEEFGIAIPPDDAVNLVSFELILDYLQNSVKSGRSGDDRIVASGRPA